MGVNTDIRTDQGQTAVRDQRCSQFCDDNRYSRGFTPELVLKLAPCPPVWNKELLWEVASKRGLSKNETDAIASKCSVPRRSPQTLTAGTSCSDRLLECVLPVLCGCGLSFITFVLVLVVIRRKRNRSFGNSRFRDTSRQKFQSNPSDIQRGVSNLGYLHDSATDVQRTDSNRSNKSTSDLCGNEVFPDTSNVYYTANGGQCTIENRHYDTTDNGEPDITNNGGTTCNMRDSNGTAVRETPSNTNCGYSTAAENDHVNTTDDGQQCTTDIDVNKEKSDNEDLITSL